MKSKKTDYYYNCDLTENQTGNLDIRCKKLKISSTPVIPGPTNPIIAKTKQKPILGPTKPPITGTTKQKIIPVVPIPKPIGLKTNTLEILPYNNTNF